jgi:aspartate beta-hydroxylase
MAPYPGYGSHLIFMRNQPLDPRKLAQTGMEALQRGDATHAKSCFQQLVEGKVADASIYLALAYACRSSGDSVSAGVAVDGALKLEPRNLRALLFKADLVSEGGDGRAASAFYLAAVKAASELDTLPADLRQAVERAQAVCDQHAGNLETMLREALDVQGVLVAAEDRFSQSLDILFGRKKAFFQEPRYYFFPGLPQIQFYDRQMFPWLDKVEAMTADIRAELVEILREQSAFKPYVQGDPARPQKDQAGMANNPDWSAFYLWKDGTIVAENAARCPKTMEAISEVPLAKAKGRTPSILFSMLRPGARIPPHNGFVNTRLICHLPLIVPPECGFRVGNETREWKEGKAWLFDDTIEHEAWNLSSQTRVILLFDVWRPELSIEERRQVTALLESVDQIGGGGQGWNL